MWIDTLPAIFGALATILTLTGGIAVAVRWVVRREMQPVRSEVQGLADRFEMWTDEHHERHSDERQAVAAAFKRSGLHPPDGWNGVNRAPADRGRE